MIGVNVITMAMEFYMMPRELEYALSVLNYFFTAVFTFEFLAKLFALGFKHYFIERWNQVSWKRKLMFHTNTRIRSYNLGI